MSAENYHLAVSGLGGKPYITKVSKADHRIMTNDRREVPKGEFIQAIMDWTIKQIDKGSDTLNITIGGKVVAEIKIIDKKAIQ